MKCFIGRFRGDDRKLDKYVERPRAFHLFFFLSLLEDNRCRNVVYERSRLNVYVTGIDDDEDGAFKFKVNNNTPIALCAGYCASVSKSVYVRLCCKSGRTT